MNFDWAIKNLTTPIKKSDRNVNSGFAVKHCLQCGYAWEKGSNGHIIIHSNFPKIGLVEKKCKICRAKNRQ